MTKFNNNFPCATILLSTVFSFHLTIISKYQISTKIINFQVITWSSLESKRLNEGNRFSSFLTFSWVGTLFDISVHAVMTYYLFRDASNLQALVSLFDGKVLSNWIFVGKFSKVILSGFYYFITANFSTQDQFRFLTRFAVNSENMPGREAVFTVLHHLASR